jgi:hypothetical protein
MAMKELLESIAAALAFDASTEARVAGAYACRTILTALEASPGMPIAEATTTPSSPVATVVAALRGVPPDQLLDLAIAKLRAALPAGTDVPQVKPLKFNIVPVRPRG